MEEKERFNFSFWLAKPIKEEKGDAHLLCMMDRTMEVIKEKVGIEITRFTKNIAQKHFTHYPLPYKLFIGSKVPCSNKIIRRHI